VVALGTVRPAVGINQWLDALVVHITEHNVHGADCRTINRRKRRRLAM
jgi:hypothetical protein